MNFVENYINKNIVSPKLHCSDFKHMLCMESNTPHHKLSIFRIPLHPKKNKKQTEKAKEKKYNERKIRIPHVAKTILWAFCPRLAYAKVYLKLSRANK